MCQLLWLKHPHGLLQEAAQQKAQQQKARLAVKLRKLAKQQLEVVIRKARQLAVL
jgi:hypothetical protein